MSYRYDIWYMGTMDQPNIFKCKIKGDNELRSYQYKHAAQYGDILMKIE